MTHNNQTQQRRLKAVILAAGKKTIDDCPLVLQKLSGRKIIDYVMDDARLLSDDGG